MSTSSLESFLEECGRAHGHVCPGQVLGVRMAQLGCQVIKVDDPRGRDRKSIIVWVEIDRCMADAVSVVTGVSLGRRTLKFMDYGKVAASFLNTKTGEGVRIAALDSARDLADLKYPEIVEKKERQMLTYSLACADELFKVERVRIDLRRSDLPGRPSSRSSCSVCGEGVNDERELFNELGEKVCRPCLSGGYYEVVTDCV